MKPTLALRSFLLGSSILAALLTSPAAFAGNTWDGGAGSGLWSAGANWNVDGIPTTGVALTFAGAAQLSTNNDLTADLSYAGINFTNVNASAFTLAGNRITLGGNITTTANTAGSTILDTISLNMILDGNRTITTNQLSNTVQHNLTISGIISQDVAGRTLTKAGSGTLTLGGANTYSGATTISGGVLSLTNVNAIQNSASVSVASGSTLQFFGGGTFVTAGTISIAGTGGAVAANSGALWFGQGGSFNSIVNAPINVTAAARISSFGNAMNQTLGGVISGGVTAGSTALTIQSQGGATDTHSWTIGSAGNASTYTGNTIFTDSGGITSNTLRLGVTNALPTATTLTLSPSATAAITRLDLNGQSQQLAGLLNTGTAASAIVFNSGAGTPTLTLNNSGANVFSGNIGTGGTSLALTKTGAGTLTLSGANTYTGGTTVSDGTLVFRNTGAQSASGTHVFAAGTTLGLGVGSTGFYNSAAITSAFGSGTILTNVTVTATTNVAVDTTAGNFTHSANITGSPTKGLVKLGTNTLFLNGANTYTGATTISAGTLSLGGTNASTTYNVNAGILSLEIASGATTPGQIATSAAVTVANGAALNINVPGGDATTTAAVLNNFALNLNGGTSLTFTGQNRATVTLPGAVTLTGANTVSFVQIRDTLVMGGAIGGTGGITFSGAGLQSSHFVRLTAQSNYGGATGITSGTAGMTLLLSTGADRLPTSTTLTITGSATAGNLAQLNLGGQSQTLAGLVSAGTAAQVGVVNTGGGTPTLTVNNSVSNTFAGILGRTGPADADLNTLVSGSSFALTKTGVGTLTLSGANGYTGTTTITAGQLIIQNATSLGTTAANTVVSGTGTLFLGTANLSIAEALNLTGTGTSSSGALRFGGGQSGMAVTGAITLGGATLIQGDGSTGVTLSGGIDLGANALTYNVDGGATHSITTVKITGTSGTLVKSGGGTLNLNASNDYTGLTTVSGGALNIGSAGSLNSGNALTVGASGTSNFANAGQTLGAVSNDNTAVNALNFSAATGTVTLASLTGAGNTRFGSNGAVTGGIATGTVTSVGALNANISGTATIAAGGLLTGTISAGTVGANSLSSTSVTGGTNTITTTAAITTVNGGNTTVGAIATIGTLTSGTANLNGATSAITTLNGGTVNLGTTVLSVSNGTTSGSITGVNGSLTKTTSGMLTLNAGTYTYQGATNVNDGTLVVNGNISTSITTVNGTGTLAGIGTVGTASVQAGGTLAPGNSIGTLNFSNTLSLAGISNFEIDPTLGLGLNRASDLANVTNGVTYGGTLNVLYGGLASDFTNGMIFNLFDGSAFSGSFGSVNLPSLTGTGLSWQDNLLTNGTLTVIPEPSTLLLGGLGLLALLRRRR